MIDCCGLGGIGVGTIQCGDCQVVECCDTQPPQCSFCRAFKSLPAVSMVAIIAVTLIIVSTLLAVVPCYCCAAWHVNHKSWNCSSSTIMMEGINNTCFAHVHTTYANFTSLPWSLKHCNEDGMGEANDTCDAFGMTKAFVLLAHL